MTDPLRLLPRHEVHALMDALSQYVENAADDTDEDDPNIEVVRLVNQHMPTAQHMLDRLVAIVCEAALDAEKVP